MTLTNEDYKRYLENATHIHNLLKGQRSGAVGKQKQIEATKLIIEILQKIIEDLPLIQPQIVFLSKQFPNSKSFFRKFLTIEKDIIKKAGASSDYANNWIVAASKAVDLSSLETVPPENLTIVISERLRIAKQILSDLERSAESKTQDIQVLLRLCHGIGAFGAFGANYFWMPTFFPVFGSMGPALSQAIAGALITNAIGGRRK